VRNITHDGVLWLYMYYKHFHKCEKYFIEHLYDVSSILAAKKKKKKKKK